MPRGLFRFTVAALSGTLFGAGLAVAQMTNPAKVLAFLDLAGDWDPSLAIVMASALGIMAIAWLVVRDRSELAPPQGIDVRLVSGAACFGLGWGLAGLCPGPAVAALSTGRTEAILFVGSMLVGMLLFQIATSDPASAWARTDELDGRGAS